MTILIVAVKDGLARRYAPAHSTLTGSVLGEAGVLAAGNAAGCARGDTGADAAGIAGAAIGTRGAAGVAGGCGNGMGSDPVVIGDASAGVATVGSGDVGSTCGGVVGAVPVLAVAGAVLVGVALSGAAFAGAELRGAVRAPPTGATAIFGAPLVAVPSQQTNASALQVCSSKMPTSM